MSYKKTHVELTSLSALHVFLIFLNTHDEQFRLRVRLNSLFFMTAICKWVHCCLIKIFVIVKEIYILISKGVLYERSFDWIRCSVKQRRYFHVVVWKHPTGFYRFDYVHFRFSRSNINEKEQDRLTIMYKEATS